VTFLFTDIEGSTHRWETDADTMRNALAAHDDVLRDAVATHRGWLFKHTGDGVCAAFASPTAAVEAAIDAQRALELPVRMGIATGEAEPHGEDYFGPVLNRAARVMAAGHGGQILVADSTAALLTGVDLIDLGPRRLRDLPRPIDVFQVRADGLCEDFPPLRALGVTSGNLRRASTSFIGRAAEIDEVIRTLDSHRVVTLTGVGGVGKTRLALEVARRMADEFPDGVWLFELAAVNDSAAIPDAVASTLGITQQPGKSLVESVAAALDGRTRLLIFDNCEHVLSATADVIEPILSRSATVKVLCTSREALTIADEQSWPVPPLDVGAGMDSAALTLFVERASSVAPHFSVANPDDAAAVLEICSRLDGIPLAIELAASRMASMTAVEVRDRLDHRFRLLVGTRRGRERHQTLRHAVAWSYDHLEDTEKRLLNRCSVFAGGFDLESLCAVTGSDDDIGVLDALDALVRKSLLTADRSAGRTRYSMLETIRQFAEERLVADGGADEARDAHALYFAAREADILALWDSPRQRDAYAWFAVELANLRNAFRWAVHRSDLEVAAAITTYATFLGGGAESYEPIAWAEELIEPAIGADHPRLPFLYAAASQCWMPGRIDAAVRYSEAGQTAIGASRDGLPFGVEGWLGAAYIHVGEPGRWVDWCRARLACGRDTHTLTRTCLVLALIVAGRFDEAITGADGLIDAAEKTRNPYVLSFALFVSGLALQDVNPEAALGALRRGLTTARDSGNRFNETQQAVGLSRLEAKCGDPLAALEYAGLAIRNYLDAGNTANMRVTEAGLAVLFGRLGRHRPAATITGFALNPLTSRVFPDLHSTAAQLREVLGDDVYESLAHAGESMTPAEMANYVSDQIIEARAELGRSESLGTVT
jgi:predicted ATPase